MLFRSVASVSADGSAGGRVSAAGADMGGPEKNQFSRRWQAAGWELARAKPQPGISSWRTPAGCGLAHSEGPLLAAVAACAARQRKNIAQKQEQIKGGQNVIQRNFY